MGRLAAGRFALERRLAVDRLDAGRVIVAGCVVLEAGRAAATALWVIYAGMIFVVTGRTASSSASA